MKSSGKGHDGQKRRRSCLIVDGYNVLAAASGQGLGGIRDLEAARDELVNRLTQYRAYQGEDVVVIFDAYRQAGRESDSTTGGIRLIFTDSGETADHRIERLVLEYRDLYREITVATSDFVEQQVTFGGGALRISAQELLRRLEQATRMIRTQVQGEQERGQRLADSLRQDVANILEKWRRQ